LIQAYLLEAALGERIGVSDEERALIGPLLPPNMVVDVGSPETIGAISKA
jgi:hypothetical protein